MYAKEAMDLIEYIWLLRMKLYINHDTNLHAVHHGLHTHSIVVTHSWEPCQAEHAAWPLLTQKLKYNSTKTGQDDETESRKTSKKEYIISNWFQRKKLHSNFGRLAKEKTHKLKPTLEILHAWVGGRVSGNVGW